LHSLPVTVVSYGGLMRSILLLLAITNLVPQTLRAQWQRDVQIPRYELGLQADFNHLDGVGEWGGGIGARFHYNFDQHFALDSQMTYRNHDISGLMGPTLTSQLAGQTNGLVGIRAGQRVRDYGFFANARAGFIHFGKHNGVSLISRSTVPAFDVGGTLERYLGPVVLRVGLSELIVPYGNATASPGPLVTPPPPGPLGTRASPIVGFGFAVRF
jgi:hypothetical protein